MNETRRGFLQRVRYRIRLAWLSTTAQLYAPYVGLGVLLAFTVDWLTPWEGARGVSLAGIAAFAIALLIGAATLRITPWDAARAAERGLSARDVFTTALEFEGEEGEVHQLIQARADQVASEAEPATAVPLRTQPERLRRAALAAGIAVVVGLLPPLGDSTALSADTAAALEAEAEGLERLAEAIEQANVNNADDIAAELERLAEQLRQAQSLEEALEALDDTQKRLDANVDPELLAKKAAVQGLARDLALRPLAGAGGDPASQFEALAEDLSGLSAPELRALADRLAELAASQAAGSPQLADLLNQAAIDLAGGDLAGAAEALRGAAASQRAAVDAARGQQALAETQRALDGIESRLSGGEGGGGEGQGDGEGGNQSSGSGQDGQQGGAGAQAGQPGGQGGGQGKGGGGGKISGVAPGSGDASGQGGQGTVGSPTGQDFGTGVETASVYDPIDLGSVSDILRVNIEGGDAQGDIVGRADTTTQQGQSLVPYAQVLPEYLNQAADALEALRLPPSMRGIVQSYFGLLADQAR
ncbi:MAG: hypothetical protein ACE5F5_08230 [Acidimicrobiia bacterium]